MAKFYITTSIMYTNTAPHIGFALELVQADALARYHRMLGDEVLFSTGTDEHGTKIMRAAEKEGRNPQEFVDGIAAQVGHLAERLAISNTDFIRTSDRVRHWPAAEKLWNLLVQRGDIYKKSYEGFYCVGHEAFVKPSELVDGLCPVHKTAPERVQEENWFFKLSTYRDRLRELLQSGGMRIMPEFRTTEILNLLKDAEDVSFSRPSSQLPWGIPVPNDSTQTMYVWADALTNYLSVLGYGTDQARMSFWPADVHLIGKDIIRFHAMIWPAMLLSAGLAIPKQINVHGFITVGGEKMSKSLGNVINPSELLDRHSAESVRYFLLRELSSTDDGDFSYDALQARYISDLSNGLGNLVQRVATMISSRDESSVQWRADLELPEALQKAIWDDTNYHKAFSEFRLHEAATVVWQKIGAINTYLNDTQPWKASSEGANDTLVVAASMICHVAWLLQPFMPGTAERIGEIYGKPLADKAHRGDTFQISERPQPLFPRPVAE